VLTIARRLLHASLITTHSRNLKPGGYIELQEFSLITSDDGTQTRETYLDQVSEVMRKGAEANKRPFIDVFNDLKPWLDEAGFKGIVEWHDRWPTNPWPRDPKLKEFARINHLSLREGLEYFMMAGATRHLGWRPEEVTVLAAHAKRDLANRAIHSYVPINVIYAQKPEKRGA